ncbi:mucin-binding protein, partial [Streptococcus suis]
MFRYKRRDIFKKRKSKVYKNLVSYGQYGAIAGLVLVSLGASSTAKAETTTTETSDVSAQVVTLVDDAAQVTEPVVEVAIEPVPIQGLILDQMALPNADALIANASELQASGATISFASNPVAGDTVATVLVTYADGTSKQVLVPVTVSDTVLEKEVEATTQEDVAAVPEVVTTIQEATPTTTETTPEEAQQASTEISSTQNLQEAASAQTTDLTEPIANPTATQVVPNAEKTTAEGGMNNEADTDQVAPKPVQSATFSWQEVPAASQLVENASQLEAVGATISYVSQPTFGMTSASILVTYGDGTKVLVAVPITVTANAVRKTLAAAVAEGTGTREVGTSPNTSGTVTGSLTSQTPTTGLKAADKTIQTTVLDISGDTANYSGGYVEVRLTNASAMTVTPSPLAGVTSTVTYSGDDAIIKYSFSPTGLNGGAYYSLKFEYALKAVDNWGNVVDAINDNNFSIITTANFYDENGLLVKELGTGTHSYTESKNGANIGTKMDSNQIVGYDLNKDGQIDPGARQLSFFVNTGTLLPDGTIFTDFYSPGTGVFDGRLVNGGSVLSGTAIDVVTDYTYDVSLVPGTTLSAASIAAGWVEDATGYHLSADRATNPIPGDSTANLNTTTNVYVPLILDIIDGTANSTITNNKSISVTGTYTKEDGTTYTNTRTTNYSVIIPTAEPAAGEYFLRHRNFGDTDIIKSYGRANYTTDVGLTNIAPTDTPYDLTNLSLRVTTNNDNEFFTQVNTGSTATNMALQAGGKIEVYDDATGTLLHTIAARPINTQHIPFTISEDLKVKTLRYEFIDMVLEKDSTTNLNTSIYTMNETTFYDDWSTIYNDSSITRLISSTTATLQNDAGSLNLDQSATAPLDRIVYNVNMVDVNYPGNMTFTSRTQTGGFHQRYNITNTQTGSMAQRIETETAAYPGELYQAYLLDPELKLAVTPGLEVIYNWNNTGKDLYYETAPVTSATDPINQNVVQIANNFVKNGTYEVFTIGFWKETDPGFVPTDGVDLTAPINGINITTANSTTRLFTVTLNASESSGVISEVKADSSSNFGFNTNGHQAQDIIDFKVEYSNASPGALDNVQVITSLPRVGDKQLDSTSNKNRNSEFSVYLTGPVTPPAGWTAVYTTVSGTSAQMEAGTWSTADQVTDWSTITAVKFVASGPVAGGTAVDFHIDNAVIAGDATQNEKAYLSSASSVGGASYIESNNVLIQIAPEVPDGTVTVVYVNEAGEVIAIEKVLSNDIKSDYDASDKNTYYPTNITGTDGLPYVYVRTDANSAPNTGTYIETPQIITHVYKLVEQTATFTYIDVTDPANSQQLGNVDSETGGSGQDIAYDTTTRINDYLKAGYEVVSNDYTDTTKYDTDDTVDQPFTIELRQRVVTIPTDANPGDPVDPTDPNSPVWPSTIADRLTEQVVTRTIEYKYIDENGQEASATVTQTANFTRTATVNLVTGEVVYGEWTTLDAELDQVTSPIIPGYTADKLDVPALTVGAEDEDSKVVVIYTPNTQVGTVTYIDESTGKTLETESLTGTSDSPIGYTTADRIAYYESIGYELVSSDYPANPVYDRIDGNSQDYQIVLKPIIKPVTPDNPVNPKDNTPLELTQTVTRTIEYKYIDENGQEASATVTQTADFTRTATVNMVTGEVIYSDWTSADAELDQVTSPIIPGYTADKLDVPALTVGAEDEDSKVVVIYTPDAQKATVTYIDETTGQTL